MSGEDTKRIPHVGHHLPRPPALNGRLAFRSPRVGCFRAMDFRYGDGRDWFLEKRFGLFVHWGLYAINGWHEQAQYRARIPRREYAAGLPVQSGEVRP
jgi:hypothetical protein